MIAMYPHPPVYSSREATSLALCACALTQVAGTDRRFGRSSAFVGQKGLVGLLDYAAIKLSNANPGGALS